MASAGGLVGSALETYLPSLRAYGLSLLGCRCWASPSLVEKAVDRSSTRRINKQSEASLREPLRFPPRNFNRSQGSGAFEWHHIENRIVAVA